MNNTSSLHYSDTGNGKVTVLLHGFCESLTVWKSITPALSLSGRVVAIDLPGFGKSSELPGEYTIDAIAQSVWLSLQALGIQKFNVIGHSLGGYVALALCELYPQAITGLGLFHSTALPDSEEKKENRNKTAAYVLEHGTEKFLRPFAPNLFFHRRREELANDINEVIDMGLHLRPEILAGVTLAMRNRPDRTALLSSCECPVMMIIGKDDNAIPLESAVRQCFMPKQSHVLFLEKTGHMGMYERPKETLAFMLAFVNAIP